MTGSGYKELLQQARADLRARNFDNALALAERAGEEAPNHPAVLRMTHDVHRASGDLEAALKTARALIQFHPSKPWGYAKAAQNLVALRDFEAAKAALDKALKRHPKDLDVLRVAGTFYRARGDRQAELEIAEALMAHHPDLPEGHCRAIQALTALGRPDRAQGLLEEALAVFPTHADVLRAAHDLHQARGDYQAALEAALLLARHNPDSAWGFVKAAQAYGALKRPEEARSYIEIALERFPKDPEVLRGASNFYRSIGDRWASLGVAKRLLSHHADGYSRAVQDLIRLRDSEGAGACLEEALTRHPNDPRILRVAGDYYRSQGKHQDSLEVLARLIEQEPRNPDAYLHAARCSLSLGRGDDAKAYCEEARSLLGERAASSTKYIETAIRAYGVRQAAALLDPRPHNPGKRESGQDRKYVFVSGIPHSDVPTLGALLNLSCDIAVFEELHLPHFPYAQSSFDRGFVEAALLSSDHRAENTAILEKSLTARYVGDARPEFYWRLADSMRLLEKDEVHVFHVVRPLPQVCRLYQQSAEDPANSWSVFRGYEAAIEEFHLMCRSFLNRASDRLSPNHRLTFVAHEGLRRDPHYALSLFQGLSLSDEEGLASKVGRFVEETRPTSAVDDELSARVQNEADLELVRSFEALSGCPCL